MGQCPSGFIPYSSGCVKECPDMFQLRVVSNQPRCAYVGDSSKSFELKPISFIFPEQGRPVPTLEELRTRNPPVHAAIVRENQRFDAALAVVMTTIDKDEQIRTAFSRLQQAENVRDESPQAYQIARVAYYTLVKGPEWIEGEKQRIARTEVNPEIHRYRIAQWDSLNQKNVQQGTKDVIRAVKEGVLSLKDDVKYTTKTFQTQIATLKNQINIDRRGRETPDEEQPFFNWINAFLNLLIVVGLAVAGYMIWKKTSAAPPKDYTSLTSNVQ